jgi:hypothetical protein
LNEIVMADTYAYTEAEADPDELATDTDTPPAHHGTISPAIASAAENIWRPKAAAVSRQDEAALATYESMSGCALDTPVLWIERSSHATSIAATPTAPPIATHVDLCTSPLTPSSCTDAVAVEPPPPLLQLPEVCTLTGAMQAAAVDDDDTHGTHSAVLAVWPHVMQLESPAQVVQDECAAQVDTREHRVGREMT